MKPVHLATAIHPGEIWDIGGGRKLGGVHAPTDCAGRTCIFHNPTQHSMVSFPMLWRDDRQIMERTCPHGVGHPDPDQFDFWKELNTLHLESIHGCDGCCQ